MSEWKSGQIILGEYTIEKELGRGGMGCVWLVRSNSTNHRFAVKQTLLKEEKHRKAFLAELQTWIDLPDHPNIVPCRFFRTVGDDIVIFADFIEGGSLADWIAKGKLTSLEQILDVAIQFAWGLHAIHERGLIHQDVKPGNVLMTLEGVPMITDFGLARARLRVADGSFVSPALPPGEDSVLVSVGGMTPAYASPEQRAGQPLSCKTDIWSWGVSVLDMFMGGVSCPHGGQIAADVLEALRENAQEDFGLLKMPGAIADILEKCFHKDPSERLMSLMIAADTVSLTYKAYTGDVYKHPKPAISARAQKQRDHKRMVHGVAYRDPAEWKQEFLPYMPMVSTQKADESSCFLDDLALFEELDLLLFKVTEKAHSRLHIRHASLLLDKGLVHRAHNDTSGEMQCYTRAIAYLESETIAGGEQSSNIGGR